MQGILLLVSAYLWDEGKLSITSCDVSLSCTSQYMQVWQDQQILHENKWEDRKRALFWFVWNAEKIKMRRYTAQFGLLHH